MDVRIDAGNPQRHLAGIADTPRVIDRVHDVQIGDFPHAGGQVVRANQGGVCPIDFHDPLYILDCNDRLGLYDDGTVSLAEPR